MRYYGMMQSQHFIDDCNDDNDNLMLRVSVWFEFMGGLF
jgi:hypothetical protein